MSDRPSASGTNQSEQTNFPSSYENAEQNRLTDTILNSIDNESMAAIAIEFKSYVESLPGKHIPESEVEEYFRNM